MKTVDLIPFILLELNEQDKYGLELTKAIENKSNGKIIVKQPTLYTVLKKLEKSKFISSYWQDSEIGGKRHYYKLTEFGKLQVSTLPSMEKLIADLLSDDDNVEEPVNTLAAPVSVEPKEAIIPSEVVFSDSFVSNEIDTATETEINLNNIEVLKDSNKSGEIFAENDSVSKFTEKVSPTPVVKVDPIVEETKPTLPEVQPYVNASKNFSSIKFVDYKDIKKDENHIRANKFAKKFIFKNLAVTLILIGALVLFNYITKFSGRSTLYYVFWISALIFAIFYPIITALKIDKISDNFLNDANYKIKNKKLLFINLSFILLVSVTILITNIGIGNNSFFKIFSPKNFENLYAPLLLSCVGLLNCALNSILFRIKK